LSRNLILFSAFITFRLLYFISILFQISIKQWITPLPIASHDQTVVIKHTE
jgi:hypothetical protein